MNKDQVKGAAKDIAGKIQEESGKLAGSKQQQARAWRSSWKEKCSRKLAI